MHSDAIAPTASVAPGRARRTIRVAHVITDLATGGAEIMLHKLIQAADPTRVVHGVVSLMEKDLVGEEIASLGAPVRALGMRRRIPWPWQILRLRRMIRELNPDILHGWMYHGNLAASVVAATLTPRPVVLWNVRQSLYDLAREPFATRLVIRANRLLARGVRCIMYNSTLSARQHERYGFPAQKTVVVPNGFDCQHFCPDMQARQAVRAELGLGEGVHVIGMVARFHPMKDHYNFLEAAVRLVRAIPQARFMLIGRDVNAANAMLVETIGRLGLAGQVMLLDERKDIPKLLMAFDVFTLSSAWGEGFPNVIGEAMAAGLPCVVTDVGDSKDVVGDAGRVVPARDPDALARAWEQLATMGPEGRRRLGAQARARVEREYGIEAITRRYEDLYEAAVS
jgi:glycosyltransferase involved in cell wall biosynthesis